MKPNLLLNNLKERLGWKNHENFIIGRKEGYWFSITYSEKGSLCITTAFSKLDLLVKQALESSFEEKKTQYPIANIIIEDNILSLIVNTDFNDEALDLVEDILNDICIEFKSLHLISGCFACGSTDILHPIRIPNNAVEACDNCYNKFEDIIDSNTSAGNYLTGIVGALLGGFLGAILWVIVSNLGFYASLIGFLMTKFIYKGYTLFHGKAGKKMPIIITLIVLLSLFGANIFEIAYALYNDPSLDLSLVDALRIAPHAFYNSELFYVDKVWMEFGLGLLFVILGSHKMIRELFESSKNSNFKIEKI